MTEDSQYNPGKKQFWGDMNRHGSAWHFNYPGYDYIVEAQNGYLKVWRAVSEDPDNEENEFEWDKVAQTEFETQDKAKSEGRKIVESIGTLRSFVRSHDVCPACKREYFDTEELDVDRMDEAWEQADGTRNPCISSPRGERTATAYYHVEEADG